MDKAARVSCEGVQKVILYYRISGNKKLIYPITGQGYSVDGWVLCEDVLKQTWITGPLVFFPLRRYGYPVAGYRVPVTV